ncbi:MAG: transporter substrate-binding domain-containing protein [Burkholderiales bacterium]|nr:transporter substrate-binding domain-containing protein [Burkholderiales bacterium]
MDFKALIKQRAIGTAAMLIATAMVRAGECRSVTVTADPEYPPFAWYDGARFHGASLDIVTSALHRIGLPYQVRYVGPFPRVLREAQAGTVDIVSELKRTPERDAYLRFTDTTLFRNPSSVFVRRTSAIKYTKWEDLKPLRGGMTNGTRFGGGFDEYLAANLHAEVAFGIRDNFAKLDAGRIDYFVSPYFPAMSYLESVGETAAFVPLQPYVATVDNFVGWSKRSPCIERLPEFDAAVAAMVKDGSTERALKANIEAWRRAPVMTQD